MKATSPPTCKSETTMDVILCHLAADFDTLGAAVGAARLYPGARILLSGGAHPSVQEFLALHRDAYPMIEMRAVHPEQLQRIILVDCQDPTRLGKAAAWLDLPGVEIYIYDHHPPPRQNCHPCLAERAAYTLIEPVGATCTLMVEKLQKLDLQLTPFEVTGLALGIHVDTGSLTFASSTARDALALAWLMSHGINLTLLARYLDDSLSPSMQELLSQGLSQMQIESFQGYQLAYWVLDLPEFVAGLAGLAMRLIELTDMDVLLLLAKQGDRLSLIGRSRQDFAQLHRLMQPYGGGGHVRAAAATLKGSHLDPVALAASLLQQIKDQIPKPMTAQDLMSSPVRTIRPETPITEAQRVLLRYGHSGLIVADERAQLVGVISRRDIDIALHHGFGHAPVKGYMTVGVKTAAPETTLQEIQALMVKWDIGRLPVVQNGQLLGIVTRTDVLRHLHDLPAPTQLCLLPAQPPSLQAESPLGVLTADQQQILEQSARTADEMGLNLYLVGGAVRDLLLGRPTDDLDLVADGPYPLSADGGEPEGWGVRLGRTLHQRYDQTRLEIHGKYQTVTLTWPNGLWVDIASARTEFYPFPAASPQVAVGSIQQDLYRRDFTINALAIKLNGSQAGQVLDFFGGLEDLRDKLMRVLHPNSFIEDPTRIYRAVRFAVRLGFTLVPSSEAYIHGAVASGLLDAVGGDRLKNELSTILKSANWAAAFDQLAKWEALRCIHPDLVWDPSLRRRVKRVGYWVHHFALRYSEIPHHEIWQLRLEVMLCPLKDAAILAENLHLTQTGIERLRRFPELCQRVLPQLHTQDPLRPSTVVQLLQRSSVLQLILLAAGADPQARKCLWWYLSYGRLQKPLLTGHDLTQLGFRPGRHFQEILSLVQQLTLDGEIHTRAEAEAIVRDRFPLTQKTDT